MRFDLVDLLLLVKNEEAKLFIDDLNIFKIVVEKTSGEVTTKYVGYDYKVYIMDKKAP